MQTKRGRPKKKKSDQKINTGFTLTPLARQLLKKNVKKGKWAQCVSALIEKKFKKSKA